MERERKGISSKKFLEDNQRQVEKKGKTEEERERRRGKREEIDGKTGKGKIKIIFWNIAGFGGKRRRIILRILT